MDKSPLYYAEFELPSHSEGSNPHFVDYIIAGQFFGRVHDCAHGRKFAWAFPLYKSGAKSYTLGRVFQLFAESTDTLNYILASSPVHRLLRDHIVTLRTPRVVPPAKVEGWQRFYRARDLYDVTKRSARMEGRYQKRLELIQNGTLPADAPITKPEARRDVAKCIPFLQVVSKSTQQARHGHGEGVPLHNEIHVRIMKEELPQTENVNAHIGDFSSYGLSLSPRGAVPAIMPAKEYKRDADNA